MACWIVGVLMRKAVVAILKVGMGLWLAAMVFPTARAETTYTFSVAPQFERRVLFGIWQPIID